MKILSSRQSHLIRQDVRDLLIFFIVDTPRFYDTVNLNKMLLLQGEKVVKNIIIFMVCK